MYIAGYRRYQVDSQAMDEVTNQVRDGFVPILSKTAGFRGYYWLKADDGSMLSISLFEDKAGADKSIRAAKDFVEEHLAKLLPYPPQVTEGEALVNKVG